MNRSVLVAMSGHYARVERDPSARRYRLLRGSDRAKDQSYFLYTLNQNQLRRVLMPLGGFTKTEVREIARRIGLPVSEKAEPREICFIPGNDYRCPPLRRPDRRGDGRHNRCPERGSLPQPSHRPARQLDRRAGPPPPAGSRTDQSFRVTAKIRSLLTPLGGGAIELRFDEPQWAITPGQSVVFYQGDTVLGGGIITRGWRE